MSELGAHRPNIPAGRSGEHQGTSTRSESSARHMALIARRLRDAMPISLASILVAIAVFYPLIVSYGPLELHAGPSLSAPSDLHWFGTDQFGRDILARVLAGTRVSILVGLAATAAAGLLGGLLGAAAAVLKGWRSELIMRLLDIVMAFPGVLLAVVLATVLGASLPTSILVLSILYVPPMARVVRGLVLREFSEDYVVSARLLGSGASRIAVVHVGVNIAFPFLVFATLIVADAILLEAALSFIGVSIPPPAPSWGNIIADGRRFIYSGAWWLSAFPGLAIFLAVLTMNSLADVLSRRLDAEAPDR